MRAALLISLILMMPAAHAVEITEVMANPDGSDDGREWIEVYSDVLVDITDWRLRESGKNHLLNSNDTGFAGYAVIADDASQFMIDYPSYAGTLIDSSFSLSNSGELVEIVLNGSVLAAADYTSVDEGMSWCPSGECDPTPGKELLAEEEVLHEEASNSSQCSPAIVERIVEKRVEVPVVEEKVIEVERKDVLVYSSSPGEAAAGSNITSTLLVVNQLNETFSGQVSSYVHSGSELKSVAHLNGWNGGWAGNKQNLTIEGESMSMVELVNMVEDPGEYNLRIKATVDGKERTIDRSIIISKVSDAPESYEDKTPTEQERDRGDGPTGFSVMAIIKKIFNG